MEDGSGRGGVSFDKVLVGDAKRIEQVVLNLLWNALKYTHKGFVELSSRVELHEAGVVQLILEVSDSGVGIAPEEQPLIFERFAIARAAA